jgi:flagellin-like hook-associated protein FlgL
LPSIDSFFQVEKYNIQLGTEKASQVNAAATTDLARTQFIQQAATAVLAQVNQAPATVLSLLK